MAIGEVDLVCKTCGKSFTKRCEKRNRREADSWEVWAESAITECPDCFRAQKEAAELEEIEDMIKKYNLVDLNGTEKQVAWAKKIRNEFVKTIIRLVGLENLSDVFWNILNQLSSASWWIDHRNAGTGKIIEIMGNMASEEK